MKTKLAYLTVLLCGHVALAAPSEEQLARWLKRFPEADANKDGKLTLEEARTYRKKLIAARRKSDPNRGSPRGGARRTFRKIAWQAVIGNALSGVVDKDGDGVGDDRVRPQRSAAGADKRKDQHP